MATCSRGPHVHSWLSTPNPAGGVGPLDKSAGAVSTTPRIALTVVPTSWVIARRGWHVNAQATPRSCPETGSHAGYEKEATLATQGAAGAHLFRACRASGSVWTLRR